MSNRVFVTLDTRGRLIRFPSGLVVPAPARRSSRPVPASNPVAQYQAKHPAPDGPPPTPPWETRSQRAATFVIAVGVFLLALSYFTDGPVSVATGAGCAVWTLAGAWATR